MIYEVVSKPLSQYPSNVELSSCEKNLLSYCWALQFCDQVGVQVVHYVRNIQISHKPIPEMQEERIELTWQYFANGKK